MGFYKPDTSMLCCFSHAHITCMLGCCHVANVRAGLLKGDTGGGQTMPSHGEHGLELTKGADAGISQIEIR